MSRLDIDTSDKLRAMVRHSRWTDDRIARWLGISSVHVERARRLVTRCDIKRVDKRIERQRA